MTEIQTNIINLIDFLGLAQGIIFGLILIIGNTQNRPSLFWGLFLFTFSIELLEPLLDEVGLTETYPNLLFLPTNFYFLSPVFLFLYTKSLITELHQKDYWLLLPGSIEFLIFTIYCCFTPSTNLELYQTWEDSLLEILYYFGALTFVVFFIIKTIRLIQKHQIQVNNYFSDTRNKQLIWVKYAAYYLLVYLSLNLISIFLVTEVYYFYDALIFALLNTLFIYWGGLYGIRQSKINVPIKEIDKPISIFETLESDVVKIDTLETDYQQLLNLMKTSRPFMNPDLTLSDLAKLTTFPTKKLSQLINQKAGVNFNTFINQYRIEVAKKMLVDPKFSHFNVIGIGFEVGFNSKANFYTVFKKITNTTPAKFKKAQKSFSRPIKEVQD